MVDVAAFGEQLLHVTVGQPKAQVPADSQHDQIRRELKAGERRARSKDDRLGGRSNSAHGALLGSRWFPIGMLP
jgi:hypothetical protein